jgi:hypothetical protein
LTLSAFTDTLQQSSSIKQITDRISSRTRQKGDTNSKKYDQNLRGSLPKRVRKEDTQLPASKKRLEKFKG